MALAHGRGSDLSAASVVASSGCPSITYRRLICASDRGATRTSQADRVWVVVVRAAIGRWLSPGFNSEGNYLRVEWVPSPSHIPFIGEIARDTGPRPHRKKCHEASTTVSPGR